MRERGRHSLGTGNNVASVSDDTVVVYGDRSIARFSHYTVHAGCVYMCVCSCMYVCVGTVCAY